MADSVSGTTDHFVFFTAWLAFHYVCSDVIICQRPLQSATFSGKPSSESGLLCPCTWKQAIFKDLSPQQNHIGACLIMMCERLCMRSRSGTVSTSGILQTSDSSIVPAAASMQRTCGDSHLSNLLSHVHRCSRFKGILKSMMHTGKTHQLSTKHW